MSNDGITTSIVPESEVHEKRVMSVDAIPDVVKLSGKVLEFIDFYDDPENEKLRKTNHGLYLNKMFDSFEMMPASMIRLLSDEKNRRENLKGIIDMLEQLQQVKIGKLDLDTVHDEFIEDKNEKYFYPTFGGKAQLEKTLREEGHIK